MISAYPQIGQRSSRLTFEIFTPSQTWLVKFHRRAKVRHHRRGIGLRERVHAESRLSFVLSPPRGPHSVPRVWSRSVLSLAGFAFRYYFSYHGVAKLTHFKHQLSILPMTIN